MYCLLFYMSISLFLISLIISPQLLPLSVEVELTVGKIGLSCCLTGGATMGLRSKELSIAPIST